MARTSVISNHVRTPRTLHDRLMEECKKAKCKSFNRYLVEALAEYIWMKDQLREAKK